MAAILVPRDGVACSHWLERHSQALGLGCRRSTGLVLPLPLGAVSRERERAREREGESDRERERKKHAGGGYRQGGGGRLLLASAFFPFARSTERIEGERQRAGKARRESGGAGRRWELGFGRRRFLVESRRGRRQEDDLGLVHAQAREAEQRRKKGGEAEHCDGARLRRGRTASVGRQRFRPWWSQTESEL